MHVWIYILLIGTAMSDKLRRFNLTNNNMQYSTSVTVGGTNYSALIDIGYEGMWLPGVGCINPHSLNAMKCDTTDACTFVSQQICDNNIYGKQAQLDVKLFDSDLTKGAIYYVTKENPSTTGYLATDGVLVKCNIRDSAFLDLLMAYHPA